MKIGDKIVVTGNVNGLTKGKVYEIKEVAYESSFASNECKENKCIYVHSEIYTQLQVRLNKDQYLQIQN